MKISQLSARTGVTVATLKYYMREGLLPPGESINKTRSAYDESHVERVRLIKALTDVGGLSIAATQRVVDALESPEETRDDILAIVQRSILGPEAIDGSVDLGEGAPSRAGEWARRRGWHIDHDGPIVRRLDKQWEAVLSAGIRLTDDDLNTYADAIEKLAELDISVLPNDIAGAVHQVVVGTVVTDPVVASIRLLAQQHLAGQMIRQHGKVGELEIPSHR